jgi:hypothetical protein
LGGNILNKFIKPLNQKNIPCLGGLGLLFEYNSGRSEIVIYRPNGIHWMIYEFNTKDDAMKMWEKLF